MKSFYKAFHIKIVNPQIIATFWSRRPFRIYTQQEIYFFRGLSDFDNSLRQGVRGQLKMDTKNTSIPLNTTRLILMYKVGQGVRGQTVLSQNDDVKW